MNTKSVQDGAAKRTPSKMRWTAAAVVIALLAAAILAAVLVKKSPMFLGGNDGQTNAAATATEQPENYTTVIATNESTLITFPPFNHQSEAHGCNVNTKTRDIAACPVVGDSYAANLTYFDTGGFKGQDCSSYELLLIMQGEEDMWPWTAKDVIEWCGIPITRALAQTPVI